jgi:hypothetical protein
VLGGVTRSVPGTELDLPHGDLISVAEFLVREGTVEGLAFVICAQAKLRTGGIGQRSRSGRIIGVDMGLQNISDPQSRALRELEIGINIALGVDNRYRATATDDVGVVGKSRHIKTFENHLYSLSGIALS